MSELPRRLSSGVNLSANWINRLLDFLRSRDLHAGPGIKIMRTPSGTTLSVAPASQQVRSDDPPMPFDCKLGPGGTGHEDETHLYCYVPTPYGGLVSILGGEMVVPALQDDADAIENDWLDVGEISAGDSVWLQVLVSSSDWALCKEAAAVIEYAWWHVSIGSSPPSGYVLAGPLAKPVLLAEWTSGGLRQRNHGYYRSDRQQADVAVRNGTLWSTSDPRTISISNDGGAMLRLHGFRSPTTIQNPYSDGGTPPSSANDILVLVRVLSSDGKTAELKYLPLAALAAAEDGEGGGYSPPSELDDVISDYHDRVDLPCPTDHDLKTPLVYFWNPCDLTDAQGNVLQSAGWQQGQFWPTGGNASQCKGASIGDSNGNVVINQDTRTLTGGTWNFAAGFSVQNVPFVRKNLSVDGSVRVDVLATTAPSGTIPSLASHEALTNLAARVSAAETSLSGLETLLSQI